ncbi:MAG: tellurite resistance protein [Actinomycetota bacterium]|nr:tellurite resistance protein [Actinomycetota bacterium]
MAVFDQTISVRATVVRAGAPHHRTSGVVRIPPNFFGIALGLSGLTGLWLFANESFGAPAAIGDGLGLVAALVWVGLMVAYLRQGARRILADGRDATLGPFLAAPVMAAYVLAADVLEPHASARRQRVCLGAGRSDHRSRQLDRGAHDPRRRTRSAAPFPRRRRSAPPFPRCGACPAGRVNA